MNRPTAQRLVRTLTALYFTAYAVAVTWPGMVPANRVEPLVLGLPFNLAWVALWVTGGAVALGTLYAVERPDRPQSPGRPQSPDQPQSPGRPQSTSLDREQG
jgi:hypothetical protein